jgi:hypothetical protein
LRGDDVSQRDARKGFSMKNVLAALPALAVVAMVTTSLPPQEYGSLTPELQTTIAQALPPYKAVDESQLQTETAVAATPPAAPQSGDADYAPKAPSAAVEATPR